MVDVLIEYANRIEQETREMYSAAGYDDIYVVSITSFSKSPVDLEKLDIPDTHVTRLYFIDGGDTSDITEGEAREIAQIVKGAENAAATGKSVALVMQCDGGISRSAACAAAAMAYLGQDWRRVFYSVAYRPNAAVFEAVSKALGSEPDGWRALDPDSRKTNERFDIGYEEEDFDHYSYADDWDYV